MKVSFLSKSKKLLLTTLVVSTLSTFSSSNAFKLEDLTEQNLASWEWHKENFDDMFKDITKDTDNLSQNFLNYVMLASKLALFYEKLLKESSGMQAQNISSNTPAGPFDITISGYDFKYNRPCSMVFNHQTNQWSKVAPDSDDPIPRNDDPSTIATKDISIICNGDYHKFEKNENLYAHNLLKSCDSNIKKTDKIAIAKIENIPMKQYEQNRTRRLSLMFWITNCNEETTNVTEIPEDTEIITKDQRFNPERVAKYWHDFSLMKNKYISHTTIKNMSYMDWTHVSIQYKLNNGTFITINISLIFESIPIN